MFTVMLIIMMVAVVVFVLSMIGITLAVIGDSAALGTLSIVGTFGSIFVWMVTSLFIFWGLVSAAS